MSDYPIVSKVMKKIQVLFHGQGCVERGGFNVNIGMLQPHVEVVSLMTLRMIYDDLMPNDLSTQSIKISKELRISVGKARSR